MVDRTKAQLEIALNNAANAHNMGRITSLINSLTPTEKLLISPVTYDVVLRSIADYSTLVTGAAADNLAANTARNFMLKVGSFTSASEIGHAMAVLAQDYNFAGLDAVTDHLIWNQKINLSPIDLGITIRSIVAYTTALPTTDSDAATANALRDLMGKVGQFISPADAGFAMAMLALDHNFAGLDAVTDHLTLDQKINLSPIDLGITIRSIVDYTTALPSTDSDAATANALRDLMAKVGKFVSPADAGFAIAMLAQDHNFAGIDAITDHLTWDQKVNLSPIDLGIALRNLINAAISNLEDSSIAGDAVRDLMEKVGRFIGHGDAAYATQILAEHQNLTVLAAVLDNITDQAAAYVRLSAGPSLETHNITILTNGNNVHEGSAGNDVIYGRGGNDTLNGGIGADILFGGLGNDTYIVDNVQDSVREGLNAGYDRVLSSVSFAANVDSAAGIEAIQLTGTAYSVNGNDLNNEITGNDVANALIGLGGDDVIEGRGGNDTIYGDAGILGVSTNPGNDRLFGNEGNDLLYGQAGDDWLSGGIGADRLAGGAGVDRFIFDRSAVGTGVDKVVDFNKGAGEVLDFSDIFADSTVQNSINDYVFARNSGVDTIFSVDIDGAGTAFGRVDVAVVHDVTNVSVSQWLAAGNIDVIVG